MLPLSIKVAAIGLLALAVGLAHAETHTITFTNNCGFGTPMLILGPNVLSTGQPITINGPIRGAIAYLQTGKCGFNGENCTIVEINLVNPTTPGSGSSTDLSLSPPHAFSATTGFKYFNGCDGTGAECTNPNCSALRNPVACQADNVNLAITFCDKGPGPVQ
ncbi:Glp-like protein [Mycena latifolia]|nr:Glp-like protein [Mycena latifolia]